MYTQDIPGYGRSITTCSSSYLVTCTGILTSTENVSMLRIDGVSSATGWKPRTAAEERQSHSSKSPREQDKYIWEGCGGSGGEGGVGRGKSGSERKGGEEREGGGEGGGWREGMWSVEGRTHSSIAGEHVEQEWQQGSACSVTSLSGPEPENAGAGGGAQKGWPRM